MLMKTTTLSPEIGTCAIRQVVGYESHLEPAANWGCKLADRVVLRN